MVVWALLGMVKGLLFIDAETPWCVCTGASGAYALAPNSSLAMPPKAIGAYALALKSHRVQKWLFGAYAQGPLDTYAECFNRQSSERKWLKGARGTRRSQTKPRRPFLDPVRTHPRASAYAPIALGGTPRVEIGTNAYTPEAPVRTHQCSPESINKGSLHHSKKSPNTISLV
ncbi:hypothetical protein PIB30_066673 [Stylosanthes scabra]|uniref:Uncharacterized protein n=1 Tax=Stylosanthes scabra TaxID=79078 RepID=A0ABU6YP79_9FABA|nr:hypothetical protein [Stylosanthes scabra]